MTIRLKDVINSYKGLKHQDDALRALEAALSPSLLADDALWVKAWRTAPEPAQKPKGKWQVTPEMLECLTGSKAKYFDVGFCDDLQALLEATGFDKNLTARRMLVAQMCHESCGFRYMKEIDKGHYLEGRSDIGNTQPGDGPKFRGCGPIQLTGRHNHQRFSDWMTKQGKADPKIMSLGTDYTAEKYPFLSAVPWILNNGYLNVCKSGDIRYATRVLNGGYNGLEDRTRYWNKVLGCIGDD